MDVIDFVNNGVILTSLDASCKEDVFKSLHEELYKNGNVKESFYDGLVKRENEFPTGLALSNYNVAIPHTDAQHIIKSCIAVATLKTPVIFQCMEDESKSIEVSVVFMLAMGDSHGHIKMLQKLVALIQNDSFLENVLKAKDKNEILNLIIQNEKLCTA
jgi:PTS system galactitol-specific IIA component